MEPLSARGLPRLSWIDTLYSNFNYNTDGYEGDGTEDGKSQDGSEPLRFIDESPTMSPQLCAPLGPNGEAVSPTPPEGLLPGVRDTHRHMSSSGTSHSIRSETRIMSQM